MNGGEVEKKNKKQMEMMEEWIKTVEIPQFCKNARRERNQRVVTQIHLSRMK